MLVILALLLLFGVIALLATRSHDSSNDGSESATASSPGHDARAHPVAIDAGLVALDASAAHALTVATHADAAPTRTPAVDAGTSAHHHRDATPATPPSTTAPDAAPRIPTKRVPPPNAVDVAPTSTSPPGFLTITATPFALIRVDGHDWGTTPVYKRRIPAGAHQVDLVSPDSGENRLHKSVDIHTGQLSRIDL